MDQRIFMPAIRNMFNDRLARIEVLGGLMFAARRSGFVWFLKDDCKSENKT